MSESSRTERPAIFNLIENIFTIAKDKALIILPVLSLVFGTIIINLHLNSYGLIDYGIIKSHTILVGTGFMLYSVFIILYYMFGVAIDDFYSNKFWYLTLITVYKTIVLSIAFYFTLVLKTDTINLLYHGTISSLIITSIFSLFLIFSIASITVYYVFGITEKYFKFFVISVNILTGIISGVIFFLLFKTNSDFKNVNIHFFSIGHMFLLLFAVMQSKKKLSMKQISPFKSEKSSLLSLNVIFGISCMILFVFIILISYSSSIYPHIPRNMGGGANKDMQFTINGKITKGKVIHISTDSYYILKSEKIMKVIETIKKSDIEEIHVEE